MYPLPPLTPPLPSLPSPQSDEDFSSRESINNNNNAFGFTTSNNGGRLSLDDIGIHAAASEEELQQSNNEQHTTKPPSPPQPTNVDKAPEPGSPGSVGSDVKFQMIDQDTGEVYDIRDLDEAQTKGSGGPAGMDVGYTLMPSKAELMERKSTLTGGDSDEESQVSKTGGKGKGVKGFFKGMTKKIKSTTTSNTNNNNDVTQGQGWRNSVQVKVTKKDKPEFMDLLLLTKIPPGEGGGITSPKSVKAQKAFKSHKGPVWVMRFSSCGRYMASGGADNVILIWEVRYRGGGREREYDVELNNNDGIHISRC